MHAEHWLYFSIWVQLTYVWWAVEFTHKNAVLKRSYRWWFER